MVPDTYPWLFFGYTAIWTILCLYIFFLGKKVCQIEKSVKDLNKRS